jgi:integrase
VPKFFEGFADRLRVPDGAREIQVFDDDLPGFGIRKFVSGKASYFVKYKLGPQQRRLTLGKVTRGNLKAMRLEASKVLAKARLGTDVAGIKRAAAAKSTVTLESIIPRYLDDGEPKWRPRYHAEVKRQLNKDWKPLHGLGLETITRQVVVGVLDDIASQQGEVAADRARTALSGVFGWAIERGLCDSNQTLSISPRAPHRARDRVLTEGELVEVWQASGGGEYGAIIRLLILTGQRRLEIGDLSWPEIDMEKGQIDLPAERTKAGRAHLVPLSKSALEILGAINRRKGRDLVFGRRIGGFSGWSKAKSELDDRIAAARVNAGAKPMTAWRLHDIRRSFVTHLNEHGFAQPHVVEAIVNHISGHLAGVAGVYNKALYLAERRQALDAWSDHVLERVNDRTDSNLAPPRRDENVAA